tara:strand:- start:30 stop:725 length:696 start_codon:yes stop_codon:yes gene_type:complete
MLYKKSFYKNRTTDTKYSARLILELLKKNISEVDSIVDIGCGSGAWLEQSQETFSSASLKGFEGDWLPKEIVENLTDKKILLEIGNLNSKVFLDKVPKCDLIISLEVLEHLEKETIPYICSKIFTKSKYILFSAALPYQGGNGHISELPLSYFVEKMNMNGYGCLDVIRGEIWNDQNIPFWYKQNIVLFVRGLKNNISEPIDIIHPECLRTRAEPSISQAWYHIKNKLKNL